jgi:benzoyl-CoA reductase/2-hydroxyglutaryl-CoA dehydratase subunit BcrC/BadD/HgdB
MTKTAIKRLKEEIDFIHIGLERLDQSTADTANLNKTLLQAMLEHNEKLLQAYDDGKPFIASYYANAPEIYAAMDLPWYSVAGPITTPSVVMQQAAQECDNLDLPTDLCTAIRLSIYYIENDMCLPPAASIAMITPCDGMQMMNQVLAAKEEWRDVPMFAPDPPYSEDDLALDYYAQEFRHMVTFIEEHTGKQLDIDRLREVVEESNKQYELWAECNELRRAVPCPYGYKMGVQVWTLIQNLWPGDPRCTVWLQELRNTMENRVQEGIGVVPEEKIRLFWYDIRPQYIHEFASWLEKEWGAVMVMDMFTYNPYTLIDTSTEESMFRGLAKRGLCDVPMVRQERGHADHFAYDITRIVKDYKIDCVVWPAHMGHKAMAGAVGIGREICRGLGVPFLYLGLDLFDNRYTTADEIKDMISKFFTAMGLG